MDCAKQPARLTRCPGCQSVFAICRHCDRGHVYCGTACSSEARFASLRRARRRHRRSPEGRLDHRDRERDRRRRRLLDAARVGDHPSAAPVHSGSVTTSRVPSEGGELSRLHLAGLSSLEASPDALFLFPSSAETPSPLRCIRCRTEVTHFLRPWDKRTARASPA